MPYQQGRNGINNKQMSINLDAEYNIGQQKTATLKMYDSIFIPGIHIKKQKKIVVLSSV